MLRQTARDEVILTRNIKTTGLSEGGLDEMVSEYLGKRTPTWAFTPSLMAYTCA